MSRLSGSTPSKLVGHVITHSLGMAARDGDGVMRLHLLQDRWLLKLGRHMY
jgi:hypothetical protein